MKLNLLDPCDTPQFTFIRILILSRVHSVIYRKAQPPSQPHGRRPPHPSQDRSNIHLLHDKMLGPCLLLHYPRRIEDADIPERDADKHGITEDYITSLYSHQATESIFYLENRGNNTIKNPSL